MMTECFVAFGGNKPRTGPVLRQALQKIACSEGVSAFSTSNFYRTTPVSDLPQADFLNGVCRFSYQYAVEILWTLLHGIEQELGKGFKAKNAPRLLDLDLLFFGSLVYHSPTLTLPHPRWKERLFVLTPLADVTEKTPFGHDVKELIAQFSNPHDEKVALCIP